ncbi:MAG: nuclear transport factor 2 family protein [Candidatus Thorarchaeota archaeon]|jgi:hypothetical protein
MTKIDSEGNLIRNTIENAIDAAFNKGDIHEIQKYFHQEFTLITLEDGLLVKTPLSVLLESVKEKKRKRAFPPHDRISIKITSVDIAKNAASVSLEFYRGLTHSCTDFFSLYKLGEEWRIVSQTTHHYSEE